MIHSKVNILYLLALLVGIVTLNACSEDWDAHYKRTLESKGTLNLYEYVKSREDLSKFAHILEMTGFNSVLSQNQTYTLWAPTDSCLGDINMKDTVELRKFVRSYITRFSTPTLDLYRAPKTVEMLNGKLMLFENNNNVFSIDENTLSERDIAMKNGIVHILKDYKPYVRNIYEHINESAGLDSLKAYISNLNIKSLDVDKSFSNGVFIDSVFRVDNYLLDTLAAIDVEDSIYTAILPDNTAWKEIYNRAFPFFKSTTTSGGTVTQDYYTRKAIVNDMFFHGRLTLPIAADTLRSTGQNTIQNPNKLFPGATRYELSNGDAYVTSYMQNTAADSWYKTIKVEAETSYYDRTTSNYNANVVSALGTGYSLSRNYYLSLEPTSQSSLSTFFVRFPLPNNLSAKYNVYCVFVPSKITSATDTIPYSMQFRFSYMGANGKQVTDAYVDKNNKVVTSSASAATFKTDGKTVQKMLVLKEFEFPFCSVYKNDKTSITTALKVQYKAVTGTYTSKNFKIDCIILEPVQ